MPLTFNQVSQKPYKAQFAFFLNGFWNAGIEAHVEEIYAIYKKFVDLDKRGDDGNELNEFDAHRVLEAFDETLTVKEMRETLKRIDVDSNTFVSALEYITFKYEKTVDEVMNAPQGDNKAAIDAAQAKMNEVMTALDAVTEKLEASKVALEVATEAHNNAVNEEATLARLEAELKQANADLQRQQDEYDQLIESLTTKSTDESLGVVKRNRAANELEQARAEDPLPLRKAKITSDAAVRKVSKQKVLAQLAVEKAKKAKKESEDRKAELESAYNALEVKLNEARAELDEAKEACGHAHGDFYFMERALFEADSRLPNKKQKFDHTKPFEYSGGEA